MVDESRERVVQSSDGEKLETVVQDVAAPRTRGSKNGEVTESGSVGGESGWLETGGGELKLGYERDDKNHAHAKAREAASAGLHADATYRTSSRTPVAKIQAASTRMGDRNAWPEDRPFFTAPRTAVLSVRSRIRLLQAWRAATQCRRPMVKAKSSPDMMWDGCAAAHGRDTVSRHGSDAMSPEGSAPRADGSEAGCDRVAASWRHTSGAAGEGQRARRRLAQGGPGGA